MMHLSEEIQLQKMENILANLSIKEFNTEIHILMKCGG